MPPSDNYGGSSTEPTNIEKRGNPVADVGGRRFIATRAQQQALRTEVGITVSDDNAKIRGRGLRKYIGVYPTGSKWFARVCNKRNPDGRKNQIHLGTFPTAEMAAIAFDTAVIFLKGESSVNSLNFRQYVPDIQSILEGCSPSYDVDNIRSVAWKAAEDLAPLISPKNKCQGLEVSPVISIERKDRAAFQPSANFHV